jgi:serine/threonine protein kinase
MDRQPWRVVNSAGAAGTQLDEKEDVEPLQPDRLDREEIDRQQALSSSEAEQRFKQELLLARQVTDKNVVRIHDLDEIDGIKFITMPFIQGDDFSTILRRDGNLPVARALLIARQIGEGLSVANALVAGLDSQLMRFKPTDSLGHRPHGRAEPHRTATA